MIQGEIDLLISCVKLPMMDGLRLSSLLRDHVQSRFTPVLLLLDDSLGRSEADLLHSNISSTLKIPFNMDELLFKIGKLIPASRNINASSIKATAKAGTCWLKASATFTAPCP